MYLRLREGKADEYISVPLNSPMKGWNAKWFYIPNKDSYTLCDVDHVPKSSKVWRAEPSASEMRKVTELLALFDRTQINGVGVTVNFVFRRVQTCKDRVHPGYEYRG